MSTDREARPNVGADRLPYTGDLRAHHTRHEDSCSSHSRKGRPGLEGVRFLRAYRGHVQRNEVAEEAQRTTDAILGQQLYVGLEQYPFQLRRPYQYHRCLLLPFRQQSTQ